MRSMSLRALITYAGLLTTIANAPVAARQPTAVFDKTKPPVLLEDLWTTGVGGTAFC